jgi:hypothetical protein
VIGQIFFTDCFLGWEFSTYGVSTITLLEKKVRTGAYVSFVVLCMKFKNILMKETTHFFNFGMLHQ